MQSTDRIFTVTGTESLWELTKLTAIVSKPTWPFPYLKMHPRALWLPDIWKQAQQLDIEFNPQWNTCNVPGEVISTSYFPETANRLPPFQTYLLLKTGNRTVNSRYVLSGHSQAAGPLEEILSCLVGLNLRTLSLRPAVCRAVRTKTLFQVQSDLIQVHICPWYSSLNNLRKNCQHISWFKNSLITSWEKKTNILMRVSVRVECVPEVCVGVSRLITDSFMLWNATCSGLGVVMKMRAHMSQSDNHNCKWIPELDSRLATGLSGGWGECVCEKIFLCFQNTFNKYQKPFALKRQSVSLFLWVELLSSAVVLPRCSLFVLKISYELKPMAILISRQKLK